ncbi:hypothetical protein AB6M11_001471 [Listeria monocytogenes]|nr:hypothetical protein [Listeria monocytogenes]
MNSTVDVGVSGSLTSGLGVAGSYFGPAGTIAGVVVGMGGDLILSLSGKKDSWKRSINDEMEHLEEWFWLEAK